MKKIITCFAFLLFISLYTNANISDTIHVSHYSISIDTMNFSGTTTIRGATTLTVHAKVNGVDTIPLSLYFLQIDSIIANNQPLVYTYNNLSIHIAAPTVMNINDSLTLKIYYQGHPRTDSQFGGFYFSGTTYAYNIGVGFAINPHNFGSAWFPCEDVFADRSTYEFHITTDTGYKAFCNGMLQSSVVNGNGTVTWNWSINQTIPTYLASIAVAPYYTIHKTYQGIPVELGVMPADSVNTLLTFQRLDSALMNDINSWGPYPFDKVGYVVVPFNGGAMENPTSIHIGKILVDGTLNYESYWVHELSHMWWGDMVTCETEQDMWLNEGWATYNENYFTGFMYGSQVYKNVSRASHRKVLQFSHILDYGYYALNNVPHNYTYGNTVYKKGADIVHSLRMFMGDINFFPACRYYLNQHAYGNANSFQLRDDLQNNSGIPMQDYFDTFVFTAGSPQFAVDSFTVTPAGSNYDVTFYTRQKQKGNSHIATMQVEFTFSDASNDSTVIFTVNATTNIFNITLPYSPVWIGVDRNEKLADAIMDYENQIVDTGLIAFPETNASVQVHNIGSDTSIIRIEHNFVAPDPFLNIPVGVRLSDYHYYKVDGILSPNFFASLNLFYDGGTSTVTGYLDNTLIISPSREDSLLLYYRRNSGEDWQLATGYTINFNGSHLDKKGNFVVDTLKKGEYVFGIRDYTIVGVENILAEKKVALSISPNPVDDVCHISFHLPSMKKGKIEVFDILGKEIYSTEIFSHQEEIIWDTYKIKSGVYSISISLDGKIIDSKKVIVEKK